MVGQFHNSPDGYSKQGGGEADRARRSPTTARLPESLRVFTLGQTAAILRVSEITVRRLLKAGYHWRISEVWIEEFMNFEDDSENL